jgi:hypothetical protein
MCVTVDDRQLADEWIEAMGLKTVGQVLSHVQRENRLVVNLLIDGREPDLSRIAAVKQAPLDGHDLYIETAEPRQMAMEVLAEVDAQLAEADRLRKEAVDLLQRSQPATAMERLSGCFTTWNNAQESLTKTAQLLRIDLDLVRVEMRSLNEVLSDFTGQLRQIREALEGRDFVTLGDILEYEATQTCTHWRQAVEAIREIVNAKQDVTRNA